MAQNCVLSLIASLAAILLVRWLSDPAPGFTLLVAKWLAAALVSTLTGIRVSGLYRYTHRVVTLGSMGRIALMATVKEIILGLLILIGVFRFSSILMDVLALVSDGIMTVGIICLVYFYTWTVARNATAQVKQAASRKNAVISGTSVDATALAREIISADRYNLIGFITKDKSMSGRVIEDRIVYYCPDDASLAKISWRVGGIDCIFLPPTPPDTPDKNSRKPEDKSFSAENIPDGMTALGKTIKRGIDFVGSAVLIVLFLPLALLCALAIKLEDGGPVLYTQERIGMKGRPFNILKFRSMRTDAEANGAQLYSGDDDPRLTRVGGFLRRHHLDELPQLINVLRGDMSFIGYRPERQYYIDQIMAVNPRYPYLYQIRPGVTSYATLYNGYTDTLDKMLDRLDLDLYYLRNHSILFDAYVLGLTFLKIVSGKKF